MTKTIAEFTFDAAHFDEDQIEEFMDVYAERVEGEVENISLNRSTNEWEAEIYTDEDVETVRYEFEDVTRAQVHVYAS